MKILGIDPGIDFTACVCIKLDDSFFYSKIEQSISLVQHQTISPDSRQPLEEKLRYIHSKLKKLIAELKPDVVVVEDVYSNSSHPKIGLKMGHIKGVIELAISQSGVKLQNLTATKIKKSLTGHGNASKEQVARMIENTFHIQELSNLHESDAFAAALAYIFSHFRRALV